VPDLSVFHLPGTNAVPPYRVEALEKFAVRTVYFVTASSPKQAEKLCRSGRVAYEDQQIEEGDEEWIETVSISEEAQTREENPKST
jgi:hypothetical protein